MTQVKVTPNRENDLKSPLVKTITECEYRTVPLTYDKLIVHLDKS